MKICRCNLSLAPYSFFLAGNSLDIIISQVIDVAARLTNYAEWMDSNANFERARAREGGR